MSHALKKSSAPLFVAFDAYPEWDDPCSLVCTKAEMENYLAYVPHYRIPRTFAESEIVCELVPIGFVYKDEEGKLVEGEVTPEALAAMLHLQSLVEDGFVPMPIV